MNSYERTMGAIAGEKIDRVPVIPLIIQHSLKISGIPHSIYSSNPEKMAESQIVTAKFYNYDGIHLTTDNSILAEAWGCNIHLPYDEPPQVVKRILGDTKDLTKLLKVDTKKSARIPVILGATKIARDVLKDDFFIKTNIDSGPFSLASAVRGEEQIFMDMYDDEKFVMDLLEICTETLIKYGKAAAEAGAHGLTFGDSTSGLIGRELYQKFAFPFVKHAITELKKNSIPVFLHVCGDTNHILDLMVDTGADSLEVDTQVPFIKAKEIVKDKVCLTGNVAPVETMLQGNPEKVYNESIKCIKDVGLQGRLILSGGCEIPRETPAENIKAMIKASKTYGK